MPMVFDKDGHELADVAISQRQLGVLELGEEVVVLYHTPQLLRYVLGEQNGSFMLRKIGQHIVVANIDGFRKYADLQRAIKAAQEDA